MRTRNEKGKRALPIATILVQVNKDVRRAAEDASIMVRVKEIVHKRDRTPASCC